MRQVLFFIPLKPFAWLPDWWPERVPIFGYGAMLFVTFLVTTWLAGRRARKWGINPQHIQDLGIWIFAAGILGARITFMIQYGVPIQDFFKIWEGGLVFYGSALGGVVGYALAYLFIIRRHQLSSWQIADIVAPLVALGLGLGRVGCLLNGCCYGNIACEHCPAIHFPLSAPPRAELVKKGLQTAGGFTMADLKDEPSGTVRYVAPASPAAGSGLKVGDEIVRVATRVDGREGEPFRPADLRRFLSLEWPTQGSTPGEVELRLTVRRDGKPVPLSWFRLPAAAKPMQLDFGFTTADCTVGEVNPDSPAHGSGLRPGDVIVRVNDQPINFYPDLNHYLGQGEGWPLGESRLRLAIVHAGYPGVQELNVFRPVTLGLHPTQVYESISMILLFLLLLAYEPFRRRDGMVMVLFIFGYSVHRFLNEMLRNDTDPLADGLTLSQNGSILFALLGLVLLVWLRRKPAQYRPFQDIPPLAKEPVAAPTP